MQPLDYKASALPFAPHQHRLYVLEMYWRLRKSSANTTHNPYPRRLILKPRICKSSTASNSQDYWEFIKICSILINSLEYKEFEHSYHCRTLTDSEEWSLTCLCMSTTTATQTTTAPLLQTSNLSTLWVSKAPNGCK